LLTEVPLAERPKRLSELFSSLPPINRVVGKVLFAALMQIADAKQYTNVCHSHEQHFKQNKFMCSVIV
jgi:hypothetical protein